MQKKINAFWKRPDVKKLVKRGMIWKARRMLKPMMRKWTLQPKHCERFQKMRMNKATMRAILKDASKSSGVMPVGRAWFLKGAEGPYTCSKRIAEVTCPCHSNGTKLTEDQAMERILTQVAKIRPASADLLNPLDQKAHYGVPFVGMIGRLQSSMATQIMLKCWRSKCSSFSSSHKEEEVEVHLPRKEMKETTERSFGDANTREDDLQVEIKRMKEQQELASLLLQQSDENGAGWNCG